MVIITGNRVYYKLIDLYCYMVHNQQREVIATIIEDDLQEDDVIIHVDGLHHLMTNYVR